MAHTTTSAVLALASVRHGVITTTELWDAGVTKAELRHLAASGVLERAGRGIYRVATSPATWQQRLRIAVLLGGTGAVVSHRAAARLHELDGFDRAPVELSVATGTKGRAARGRVHQTSDLARSDLVHRDRFPVTNPARTLADLGGVVPPQQLEVAVDDALRRGLTTVDRLRMLADRLARPGREGIAPLRSLLRERATSLGTTESALETMLLRVLLDGGLPHPVPQFELVHRGERIGRFDFAYPPQMVIIEADSERWHTRRDRFIGDRTRRDRAEAIGWSVFAFTHHHVTRQQPFVVSTVGSALESAA
ncbi:MAG: type IV toxin-antitoxin system AbiEi family antitoxin domain-containing protein [Acidimicrobiales bacterium]